VIVCPGGIRGLSRVAAAGTRLPTVDPTGSHALP
jgi:hypothetical protein